MTGFAFDRTASLRRRAAFGMVALCLCTPFVTARSSAQGAADAARKMVTVIVRSIPGQQTTAESSTQRVGGRIGLRFRTLHGFQARVPSSRIDALRSAPGVVGISVDSKLHAMSDGADTGDPTGAGTSLRDAAGAIDALPRRGGQGVGVALIDSGVTPVDGLAPSDVVQGPDLSFDQGNPGLRYLDLYGHGTHMAGIIAGSGPGHRGIAPASTLLNVKVGNAVGMVDVSQVLAAIDWVVQHRHDPAIGAPIRVINISYGTDSTQPYQIDPLAYAAEVAWKHGIVVVAAAGNAGYGSQALSDPASDPYVIAVGADDTMGTTASADDTVPDWSSRGNDGRHPDVVAPGRSILSLRDPGSYIDSMHPDARVDDSYFKGSGTSQATAVVSGAVADLLSRRPNLTPDQVKALLTSTAHPLPNADDVSQGSGLIDLVAAEQAPVPGNAAQRWPASDGTGSLEAARGSSHVSDPDGNTLTGEQDIFGNPWDGTSWSGTSWSGTSWSGGDWNGTSWSGTSWSGTSWSGTSWSGTSWSGTSWSGTSWSGTSWSGTSWSGTSWSGTSWSGTSWSGTSWSGTSWSGTSWS
jgi:serine protease AprX